MPYSLVTQPAYDYGQEPIRSLTSPIRHYLAKIEWLDWLENMVGDYTADIVDGNISCDVVRDVRRSFSMVANNSAGLYIPNGARTNMGVKVRIRRGIRTPSGDYWWNRGVFVLTDPEAVNNVGAKTVNLQGLDKWALLNGDLAGEITETIVIPLGTNVGEAIRAVATLGGETKFNFDVCAVTTPYTITKEPGDNLGSLLKELALIPSWELFYDVDGYLRFRPLQDPLQKQVVADMSVGGTYRKCYLADGSSYRPEWSRIRNHVKVIGYSDPDTGIIYDGIAQNNNPDSPTNTFNPPVGIGVRSMLITDTNLTTDSLCVQRAAYELRKVLSERDRTSSQILPLPFLNEGDCVQLEDTAQGIADDKYQVQSFTEPLGATGAMQIECWRAMTLFEVVSFDDFQTGLGEWQVLGNGAIDIAGFGGNNCLRKTSHAGVSGGYRLLSKPCTDFELIVFTRRDALGTWNDNQYAIVNEDGTGYGVTLKYSSTAPKLHLGNYYYYSITGSSVDVAPELEEWYTLRLVKVASNITAELHAGRTMDFANPLTYIERVDDDYVSFDRVVMMGGYVYYTDDVTVRKLL